MRTESTVRSDPGIGEARVDVETILEQTGSPADPNYNAGPSGGASTPAHESAVWKPPGNFWRDVSPKQTEQGATVISLAEIDPGRLHGFYGVEYESGRYFRWAQPEAEIKVELLHTDYDLTVDSGHLWNIWNGNLRIAVNDGPIQVATRNSENHGVTVRLPSDDFARSGEQRIRLIFDALDTASWDSPEPRSLGAPIIQLTLVPRKIGGWLRRFIVGSLRDQLGDLQLGSPSSRYSGDG